MERTVGEFTADVINLLQLDIAVGTKILLSEDTVSHIMSDHPDVAQYLPHVQDIILRPQFVGFREKDNSIEFVKMFEKGKKICLILPVRPSSDTKYFVRTLHSIDINRFDKYLKKGKFIDLTTPTITGII